MCLDMHCRTSFSAENVFYGEPGLEAEARKPNTSRAALAAALEVTQGQMDGFLSQLPFKCHLEEVASVGD